MTDIVGETIIYFIFKTYKSVDVLESVIDNFQLLLWKRDEYHAVLKGLSVEVKRIENLWCMI